MFKKIYAVNIAILIIIICELLYCLMYTYFDFTSTVKFDMMINDGMDFLIKGFIIFFVLAVINTLIYVKIIKSGIYIK